MASETPTDLAYEQACDTISTQRARLDNVRARATALITAASVVAAFLGGQSLADTRKIAETPAPVADRSVQPLEILGLACFVFVLFLATRIIVPKFRARPKTHWWQLWRTERKQRWQLWRADGQEWRFRLNADKMLEEVEALRDEHPDADEQALAQLYKRKLVGFRETHYRSNEPQLELRFRWLLLAMLGLAVEALAFGLDLIL